MVEIKVPYILASDILYTFYHFYREEFNRRFLGGSVAELKKFWDGLRPDDPRLQAHPLRRDSCFPTRCIPMGVHGDGVPYKKSGIGMTIYVATFFSILALGTRTWDTRCLQWTITAEIIMTLKKHGIDTLSPLFDVGEWDWNQCLAGVYDDKDPWGCEHTTDFRKKKANKFIAGGFFAGLLQLRMDTDWAVNVYHIVTI